MVNIYFTLDPQGSNELESLISKDKVTPFRLQLHQERSEDK